MSDINFQPVFDYIDNSQLALKEELVDLIDQKISVRLDQTNQQIANLASEVKEMRQEMHVTNHRLDRLETWVPKVAKKTEIPFKF